MPYIIRGHFYSDASFQTRTCLPCTHKRGIHANQVHAEKEFCSEYVFRQQSLSSPNSSPSMPRALCKTWSRLSPFNFSAVLLRGNIPMTQQLCCCLTMWLWAVQAVHSPASSPSKQHVSMLSKSEEGITGFSATAACAFLEEEWSTWYLIRSSPWWGCWNSHFPSLSVKTLVMMLSLQRFCLVMFMSKKKEGRLLNVSVLF